MKFAAAICSAILVSAPILGHCGAVTEPLKITSVRTYNVEGSVGGAAYIGLEKTALCNTGVYMIDLSWSSSKEVFSTALSAFLAGTSVVIEIANSTGCTGWGTKVQSINMIK